jgi:acyl-coenzyme A synthetase/AMP-(fatty) acid ligase
VLISGTNHPWLAACLLAVIRAGAIAVPAMPMLRAKELSTMAMHARVSHILCDEQVFTQVAQMEDGILKISVLSVFAKRILHFCKQYSKQMLRNFRREIPPEMIPV